MRSFFAKPPVTVAELCDERVNGDGLDEHEAMTADEIRAVLMEDPHGRLGPHTVLHPWSAVSHGGELGLLHCTEHHDRQCPLGRLCETSSTQGPCHEASCSRSQLPPICWHGITILAVIGRCVVPVWNCAQDGENAGHGAGRRRTRTVLVSGEDALAQTKNALRSLVVFAPLATRPCDLARGFW